MDAANSVIGCKLEMRQPWMTTDTFEILQLKAAAGCQGLVHECCRFLGVFNAKAKLDREAYFNSLADEAQLGILHKNLRPAYRTIACIYGKRRNNGSIPVLKFNGSSCSSGEEILSRWQEHFDSVLNFSPAAPCFQLENLASTTPPKWRCEYKCTDNRRNPLLHHKTPK